MFISPARSTGIFSTILSQLSLIYTITVHNLRSQERNPIVGLVMVVVQAILMILGFVAMFFIIGVRTSPLRGDFLLYLVGGIFLYQSHTMAVSAVTGAGSGSSPIMKHGPMNTAVVITAAALTELYRVVFAATTMMGIYWLFRPFKLESATGCLAMLILAWFSGAVVGLVFVAIRPWAPRGVKIMVRIYTSLQMLLSGKMFVANALPPFMLGYFSWNPLFHIVDQMRGYMFINYSPQNSSLSYPIYVSLGIMLIGLMGEFVTRRAESASWSASH